MTGNPALRPGTLLILLLASPASWAATYQYIADTVAPTGHQGAVPAGGINWNCAGSRCAAVSTAPLPTVATCHALAQQVGPVKGYGHKKRALSAGELQQCNAGIATGKPAGLPTTTLVRAPQAVTTARGPIVINTATLRYTGRGPVVINTDPLHYVGQGPVVITTDALRYTGRGPVVITTEPLRYTGPIAVK